MSLRDIQSYGESDEHHRREREPPNSRLGAEKKEEQYAKMEQELEFADYFWRPADAPGSLYWKKIGVALGATVFLGLLALLLIFFIDLNRMEAIVLGGILGIVLVGLNLRGSSLMRFLVRRSSKGLLNLHINERFKYSFLKDQKDILFIWTRRALIGVGLFRLKAVPIKLAGSFERFIRSIYQQQVSLFWFHLQSPVPPDTVVDKDFQAITDKARKDYEEKIPHKRVGQLESHAGIWNERIIIGACRWLPIDSEPSETTQYLLREIVLSELFKIRSAFKQTFPHAVLEPLTDKELVTAYSYSIQGNAPVSFCTTGNESVQQFLQVPQIATKSIPHHFPAEFIVPTVIPHDLRLGRAFEPEFQQREVLAGFITQDLLKGVLVTGGTTQERFMANTKLVYTAAEHHMNYLIITTNPEWRRMLDYLPTACLFRMGEDLIWNPLDSKEIDNTEINEYAHLLMQVFAQLFHLSAPSCQILLGVICSCLETQDTVADLDILTGKIQDLISTTKSSIINELTSVYKFLENIRFGRMITMLGPTNISLKKLVQGVNILEMDLKSHINLQFLVLCLLAKILAYSRTSSNLHLMVLVDFADILMPHDPQTPEARNAEQYLLEWIRDFRDYDGGLHLSLQTPSRFSKVLLNNIPNILAHRTASYEDNKYLQDVLQFLPPQMVLNREVRHDNWEPDYLKELPRDLLIMKHPNINNGFPIHLTALNFSLTHLCSPEEIQTRLKQFFPEWVAPAPDTRTVLERDFGRDVPVVTAIISLLNEYSELGVTALLSSLNTKPQTEVDGPILETLLAKMVQLNYLVPNSWDDGRGHNHNTYQLNDKGRIVNANYNEALRTRMEQLSQDSNDMESRT